MCYDEWQQRKEEFTATLAAIIEAKLIEMGEDIKGLSWFSSIAEQYNLERMGARELTRLAKRGRVE